MTLEAASQVGDLLSGVFSLCAFVALIWAAVRVVPAEMAKFRAQKRAEIIAVVAQQVWEAVFRFSVALEAVCSPFSRGPERKADGELSKGEEFIKSWHPRLEILAEAANRYVEAWGLAEMYLEQRHADALEAFWKVRASITVDLEMYARGLDSAGWKDEEAYKNVFGGKGLAEVKQHKAILKELLREFAHVAAPHSPPVPVKPA